MLYDFIYYIIANVEKQSLQIGQKIKYVCEKETKVFDWVLVLESKINLVYIETKSFSYHFVQ